MYHHSKNSLHDGNIHEVFGVFFICIPNSFHQDLFYTRNMTLTSLCRVVLEADPLAAAFAVQRQELLLLLIVDADQISSSGNTVLTCCSPALL